MKNMKLKVIALVLVIPLILIFTTSSVAKTIDILVDVPVSSVRISEIDNKSVDLADGKNVLIETIVEPANATNKNVTLSQEATKGKENNVAKVKIEGNRIIPLSKGNVTIRATVGEKFDTVDLYFYSSEPLDGDVEIKNDEVYTTEGSMLNASDNLNLKIDSPSDMVFSVDDESIASVNSVFGTVQTKTPGKTTVRVRYEGISISDDGVVTKKNFEHSFALSVAIDRVKNPSGISLGEITRPEFVDIDGGQRQSEFYFWYDETEYEFDKFNVSFDNEIVSEATITKVGQGKAKVELTYYSFAVIDKDGTDIVIRSEDKDLTSYKIVGEYEHNEDDDDPTAITLSQNRVVIVQKNKNYQPFATILDQNGKAIDGAKYYAVVSSSNEDVLKIKYSDGGCLVVGVNDGKANIQIVLRRRSDNEIVAQTEPIAVTVLKLYRDITIDVENMIVHTKKSALDGVVAIGYYSFSANGEIVNFNDLVERTVRINGTFCTGENVVDGSQTKCVWYSSDENVASIVDNKLILGGANGEVVLTIKNADETGIADYDDCRATITINVVRDGVNVSDDVELFSIWKGGKKDVVLTNDITIASQLGKFIDDYLATYDPSRPDPDKTKEIETVAKTYLHSMYTTGEGSYYLNNGLGKNATINYLFEITTDLYGNGYYIDADILTRKLVRVGITPLFKGPLNLVSYSNTAQDQNAAVKAQDNIVFVVLKDNVDISNVELKGCSDSSITTSDGKNVDLTLLDNVGTVLEIVGDKCSVSYSRINNGRTVVRAYGRSGFNRSASDSSFNPAENRITARVSNSILGYGREFILKIGTNFSKKEPFVDHGIKYLNSGDFSPTTADNIRLYDEASPYLTRRNGEPYNLGENYVNDSDFYDDYVLTDITVENCVLRNAGLFSVGLESTFGGLCLHGYDYSSGYLFGKDISYVDKVTNKNGIGWKGVAGTSYPAILRLEGDVRFYDWKLLSSVNSDTLIEGSKTLLDTIGLNMNVSTLIEKYASKDGNSSIVSIFAQDKQKYVNGAIALYGGGKNYSMVDTSLTDTANFEPLKYYEVPVSCFSEGRDVLIYYTAGIQPFRFYLYDATSSLSVAKQQNDFNDGSAFSWLMKK